MEKIFEHSISHLFLEDFFVIQLIEFSDITDVVRYRQLSSSIKDAIEQENYALFLKLKNYLHIPYTYDSSELAAQENMIS